VRLSWLENAVSRTFLGGFWGFSPAILRPLAGFMGKQGNTQTYEGRQRERGKEGKEGREKGQGFIPALLFFYFQPCLHVKEC